MRKGRTPVVEADLHEFVDRQISPDREAAVVAHLAEHPAQAARVQQWRRQNETIRAAFERVAREQVPVTLSLGAGAASRYVATPTSPSTHLIEPRALIETRGASEHAATRSPHAAGFAIAGFVLGLAAACGGFGVWLYVAGRADAPVSAAATQPSDFAGRALSAYRVFGGEPPEISSHGANLQRWLQQRTGVAVVAPDLSAEGLSCIGARVTPDGAGAAALLIYDGTGGERYLLEVARAPANAAGAPQEIRFIQGADANVATFFDAKGRFALVGRAGSERMLRLAHAVARQAAAARR